MSNRNQWALAGLGAALSAFLVGCGGSDSAPPVAESPAVQAELSGPSRALTTTFYDYDLRLPEGHTANGANWVWGDGSANGSGVATEKMFRKPGSYKLTVDGATAAGTPFRGSQQLKVFGSPLAMMNDAACALLPAGTVSCWGADNFGQLGDGSANDGAASRQPVAVSGLTGVVALAGSGSGRFACALGSNGAVWCWGANDLGQLGDGSTTSRNQPVPVSGLGAGVVAVSAGQRHACALKSDATVVCWGDNGHGQLGDGTTARRLTPVAVSSLADVQGLAAGQSHQCALIAGGTVKCWGSNSNGQLGDGSATDRTLPVAVTGLSGVADVQGLLRSTCALKANRTVACWGLNDRGQLGSGSNNSSPTPLQVAGLKDATALSRGCALRESGGVVCWGINDADVGQLGNGGQTDSNLPVTVSGLAGVAAVATGYSGACALLGTGGARCWGSSYVLGNNALESSRTPVSVIGGDSFWK